MQDGQAQRIDIVIDSREGAVNRLNFGQMEAGFADNVARTNGSLNQLLDEFTFQRDGLQFPPVELVVIDIATNQQRVLYRAGQ